MATVNGQVYLLGGNESDTTMRQVTRLDSDTLAWEPLLVEGAHIPTKRSAHSSAVHGDFIYVFGGWDGSNELGDLHRFDVRTRRWEQVQAIGPSPTRRHFHNSACVGKYLIVFGGYDGDRWRKDSHVLDLDNNNWARMKGSDDAPAPGPRASASAVVVADSEMLVLGGYDGNDFLDDMWSLRLVKDHEQRPLDQKFEWVPLTPSRSARGTQLWPVARSGHSADLLLSPSGENLMVMFGGRHSGGRFNDLHIYNVDRREWHVCQPAGRPPAPRKTHASVINSGRLIVFGGHNGEDWLSDMHIIHLKPHTTGASKQRRVLCTVPASTMVHDLCQMLPFDPERDLWTKLRDQVASHDAQQYLGEQGDLLLPSPALDPGLRALLFPAVGDAALPSAGSAGAMPTASPIARIDAAEALSSGARAPEPAGGDSTLEQRASTAGRRGADAPAATGPATASSPMTQPHLGAGAATAQQASTASLGAGATAAASSVAVAAVSTAGPHPADSGNPSVRSSAGAGGPHTRVVEAVDPIAAAAASASRVPAGGATGDVAVRVGGQSLLLHRCILQCRCAFFESCLAPRWVQADKWTSGVRELDLPHACWLPFLAMVTFLYTDERPPTDVMPALAAALLEHAQQFQLPRLTAICQQYLESRLCADNAAAMLEFAEHNGARDLRRACTRFILSHFRAVIKTIGFLQLREELMREMVWRKARRGEGPDMKQRLSYDKVFGSRPTLSLGDIEPRAAVAGSSSAASAQPVPTSAAAASDVEAASAAAATGQSAMEPVSPPTAGGAANRQWRGRKRRLRPTPEPSQEDGAAAAGQARRKQTRYEATQLGADDDDDDDDDNASSVLNADPVEEAGAAAGMQEDDDDDDDDDDDEEEEEEEGGRDFRLRHASSP